MNVNVDLDGTDDEVKPKHVPTQRRSLSGKLVPLEPPKAWWIATPERLEATKTKDREPKPAPVFVCECREPVNNGEDCILTQSEEHLSTEFGGYNRRERRARGERGGYAKSLALRLGPTLFS